MHVIADLNFSTPHTPMSHRALAYTSDGLDDDFNVCSTVKNTFEKMRPLFQIMKRIENDAMARGRQSFKDFRF
jgi:hypothetical protein